MIKNSKHSAPETTPLEARVTPKTLVGLAVDAAAEGADVCTLAGRKLDAIYASPAEGEPKPLDAPGADLPTGG